MLLQAIERNAFGVDDNNFARYLLNHEGCAPCALHSWGSQLVACECGCRASGLSWKRLEEKGLFGLLVRSTADCCYQEIRHIHPNECLALLGFDPIIDFGSNPRLTLAAAGQMASPLQALWIFACLASRLSQLRFGSVPFTPFAQLQAYQAWVLMRCRQAWPCVTEPICDEKMASLIRFWTKYSQFSIHELMHPARWPQLGEHEITIASILDLIIREQQGNHTPMHDVSGSDDMCIDDSCERNDEAPTPWFEQPSEHGPNLPSPVEGVCRVVFFHEFADPITLTVSPGGMIHELVRAQAKLVGDLQITTIVNQYGVELSPRHVIEAGQVICIRCEDSPATEEIQSQRVEVRNDEGVKHPGLSDDANVAPTISPTVEWSQPICEVQATQVDLTSIESRNDGMNLASPDAHRQALNFSWISAAPLLGLDADQLLKLQVPVVVHDQHVWALRQQVIQPQDRIQLLNAQAGTWSDDEFRHHLTLILNSVEGVRTQHEESQPLKHFLLDPLLSTGWVHHGTQACSMWGLQHPEIKLHAMTVVTVCMIDQHWIPVIMTPQADNLHVCTWDTPGSDHSRLNMMCEHLAHALGFLGVSFERHHRLFFSSDKCGALAMAFVSYAVCHTMLPTTNDEAEIIHQRMRSEFRAAIENCQMAFRPWIWGKGDHAHMPPTTEGLPDAPPQPAIGLSHTCISKEARMALLRYHDKEWGDDEIRFHIQNMLAHADNVTRQRSPVIPGFETVDPLILHTWDTVGKGLFESWCRVHPQIADNGHHVVAALLVDRHWVPIWVAPHGKTLVVHLLHDGITETAKLEPFMEVLRSHFGFNEVVFHWTPQRVPAHDMCGAAAIAFLGYLIVGADLPEDLLALRYMHSNMKAGFVQAVYLDEACRCPVAWGSGPSTALVKALSDELAKHGVPDGLLEQRSQQAIRAIGSEPLQNALKAKNVWRSLKTIANNVRFQFILPEELAAVVESNKGAPVGKKPRGGMLKSKPVVPEVLDPAKLALLEGAFRVAGQPVPQIAAQQIGPVAAGVAMISYHDALPYLKNGRPVSNGPLAIAVLSEPHVDIQTALPHTKLMVPCICSVNSEPLLVEATLVQLGVGFVEKHVNTTAIALDPLDVVTVKILAYRDEFAGSWDDFTQAPIKQIVNIFPTLRRCHEDNCKCEGWHNVEDLPVKEPIMDVWRRQFLTLNFRSSPPAKSEVFSVCIRIPRAILHHLLARSGQSGAYLEPRTPDGKQVLEEYVVIWAPRMSSSELAHLRQTNPAVIGIARLGERRGVRVLHSQAQAINDIVRPDTTFLPSGPKVQYVAGPFPWGIDRAAITRALKQFGWQIQALQPMQPVPGKGSMWLLQSVEAPPETILTTTHGEVVITKHKTATTPLKQLSGATVGSVNTLSLCAHTTAASTNETDPWVHADPWGAYTKAKPAASATLTNDGIQQLEERIQTAVLAKIPSNMDEDVPARLSTLEGQVHQLMQKNQSLENQFTEFSAQSSQQFALVQTQIHQQSTQFHGQLETQSQSIQAMFEQQMNQIRGLLSKRPRDDNME